MCRALKTFLCTFTMYPCFCQHNKTIWIRPDERIAWPVSEWLTKDNWLLHCYHFHSVYIEQLVSCTFQNVIASMWVCTSEKCELRHNFWKGALSSAQRSGQQNGISFFSFWPNAVVAIEQKDISQLEFWPQREINQFQFVSARLVVLSSAFKDLSLPNRCCK